MATSNLSPESRAYVMTRRPRRAHLAIAAVTALAAVSLTPVASHADTTSTVTVVGTSDVFDSDLVQQVIKPDFEKAYPKYTLNYVSQGTGAAIAYAEAGTASALLVHAASLENQFVGSGYSLEQYGRAIFYGDYVLLGPASDPAGALSGGAPSHDIVAAFEKIAAAGAAGHANFVSRGGTPGTTVQEHAIWGLTTGVTTCPVLSTSGGGDVPDQNGGACTTPALPSWYHTTGLTQGPNVVNGDTCNYPSASAGNNCYVLTDRGTFQYLESQGALSHLKVVVNDEGGTSTQQNLLVNSFHAYALNPTKFTSSNVHINQPGAEAFLTWLTSPVGQAEVNAYDPGDSGNPPFKEDAAPALTASRSSTAVTGGKSVTVSGSLTNKVPGTPSLAGVAMTLTAKPAGGGASTTVGTTSTSATGAYSFAVTPTGTASYTVSSAAIAQVENATLTPLFGDLLEPTSKAVGSVTVKAAAAIKTLTATTKGVVTVKGTLAPKVVGSGATVRVLVARSGHAFHRKLVEPLKTGASTFTAKVTLKTGATWRIEVQYVNSGSVSAGTSAPKSVHVP
jgi:tungstate transport system substrate-binding protein